VAVTFCRLRASLIFGLDLFESRAFFCFILVFHVSVFRFGSGWKSVFFALSFFVARCACPVTFECVLFLADARCISDEVPRLSMGGYTHILFSLYITFPEVLLWSPDFSSIFFWSPVRSGYVLSFKSFFHFWVRAVWKSGVFCLILFFHVFVFGFGSSWKSVFFALSFFVARCACPVKFKCVLFLVNARFISAEVRRLSMGGFTRILFSVQITFPEVFWVWIRLKVCVCLL